MREGRGFGGSWMVVVVVVVVDLFDGRVVAGTREADEPLGSDDGGNHG